MKIKTKNTSYEKVISLKRPKDFSPMKPLFILRLVVRILAIFDLAKVNFKYTLHKMDKIPKEPVLILMNHSSFIDLKIVSKVFLKNPYCIVCTSDGFVGKSLLMRLLGCIPTKKFTSDPALIKNIQYALKEKKTSVLMYPEASYSFDGCATPLPNRLGRLLKFLDVPVVYIQTHGAFSRDPLYNGLQLRKVNVSADVTMLLTRDEIKEKSVKELDFVLNEAFSFDNFKWQQENKIKISEPFRADGLNRILYRCPNCLKEGFMKGEKTKLVCQNCGETHTLDEYGFLSNDNGNTKFSHIPDWYNWQREEVKNEILNDTYKLDVDVEIGMMVDYKAIYMVGNGHLTHDKNGFVLTGCDGKLNYSQKPLSSYGLYADYFWYEINDVICIGNEDALYYCFPKGSDVVAKTRLATEELYKIVKDKKLTTL